MTRSKYLTVNPDFRFAHDEVHEQLAKAFDCHKDGNYRQASRHLRLAARSLNDAKQANALEERFAGDEALSAFEA